MLKPLKCFCTVKVYSIIKDASRLELKERKSSRKVLKKQHKEYQLIFTCSMSHHIIKFCYYHYFPDQEMMTFVGWRDSGQKVT